jgi:hypothetical protein
MHINDKVEGYRSVVAECLHDLFDVVVLSVAPRTGVVPLPIQVLSPKIKAALV